MRLTTRRTAWLFAALMTLASPFVGAAPVTFTAVLDGLSEDTPNSSPGIGSATVTFNTIAHEMRVEATFSGLVGTTTAAHIHCCTTLPGSGTANVATTTPSFVGFPLGVTDGAFDRTYNMLLDSSYSPNFLSLVGLGDALKAEEALLQGMLEGTTYFNIHTNAFLSGEIRGFLQQVQAVPEPHSLALAGLGLLALACTRRRRATSRA